MVPTSTWVVVKELSLSYHPGESKFITIHIYIYVCIYPSWYLNLSSLPAIQTAAGRDLLEFAPMTRRAELRHVMETARLLPRCGTTIIVLGSVLGLGLRVKGLGFLGSSQNSAQPHPCRCHLFGNDFRPFGIQVVQGRDCL